MSDHRNVSSNVVTSKEVVGVAVKNTQQENLGKIEEIVLDKHKGHVKYVVLSFGGILSLGSKLFPLPWEAISYNEEHKCFILRVEKEKLEKAPGFDKDHWPDMADHQLSKSVHDYYGSF